MKWNLLLWWYPRGWRLRNLKIKNRISLIMVRAMSKAVLPSVPDANNRENYWDLPNIKPVQKPEERKWWTFLSQFCPCLLELFGNTVIEVDSSQGSLWLSKVLWGYLLAADFPEWKDVGQYLLCYCQILFMRPNCIIVPGYRLCSSRDHICANPEVSCRLQMGQRWWNSASWIEVKVTNFAHDLWRLSSWQEDCGSAVGVLCVTVVM